MLDTNSLLDGLDNEETENDFCDKDPNYSLSRDDHNSSDSEEETGSTNFTQPHNMTNNLNTKRNHEVVEGSEATEPPTKRQKKSTYAESHPLGNPCGPKCNKKCTINIEQARRKLIWEDFTYKVYNERKKIPIPLCETDP